MGDSGMHKMKLPQPYALRIEMIRAKGFSDRELLALLEQSDSAELLAKVDAELNWDNFLDYVGEHWDTVKTAVLDGYQFSFISIGGIKNLLSIRFKKVEDQDYRFDGTCIEQLKLSNADLRLFRSLVPSTHWNIIEIGTDPEDGVIELKIELNAANAG
jgi:hypothetical protein